MTHVAKIIEEREKALDALLDMRKYPDAGFHKACNDFKQQHGMSWSRAEREIENERRNANIKR